MGHALNGWEVVPVRKIASGRHEIETTGSSKAQRGRRWPGRTPSRKPIIPPNGPTENGEIQIGDMPPEWVRWQKEGLPAESRTGPHSRRSRGQMSLSLHICGRSTMDRPSLVAPPFHLHRPASTPSLDYHNHAQSCWCKARRLLPRRHVLRPRD